MTLVDDSLDVTRIGRIALLPILLAAAAGCGSSDFADGFAAGQAAATPAAAPGTAPTAAPSSTPTLDPAAVPAEPVEPDEPVAPTNWQMPDLVGTNLQDAQDAIQSLTDYGIPITRSHDTTGEDRNQILDANWQVCDQNVDSGQTITSGTLIDFGVVKTDEQC